MTLWVGKGKPGLPLGEEEDVGYICTCVCTSSPHRYSTSAFFPDDCEWRRKWRGTTGKETAHEVNASGLRVFRRHSLQTKRPLVPLRIHVLSHWKHSCTLSRSISSFVPFTRSQSQPCDCRPMAEPLISAVALESKTPPSDLPANALALLDRQQGAAVGPDGHEGLSEQLRRVPLERAGGPANTGPEEVDGRKTVLASSAERQSKHGKGLTEGDAGGHILP
jgi:hypothetical protein